MAVDPNGEGDADDLARLGYAQQLLREMGGFSSFALSFSVISILTGAVTLYGHGLKHGGPFTMTVGWPLVALMTATVAASLAELASAYPTAGALYHWSSILGGRGAGYFTAWFNVVGQLAIVAGIDFGLAQLFCATLGWPSSRVLVVYASTLFLHAALNHLGVRAVARLNDLSAWYHLAGVAIVVGALAFFAPKQPASFLFTRVAADGESYGYAFAIGLLQAQWTFTGYDASAHVTEETKDPRRNAPWGIFLSVAVSAVVGWILLVFVTLSIRNLSVAHLPNEEVFLAVVVQALGERLGRAMAWIAIGAMWFCGLSSVTSCSRMLFAFARDGGTPASKQLATVSDRFKTPATAIWVSAIAAFVVAWWAAALSVITALSTIALYASYVLPIVCTFTTRGRARFQRGPWSLGRASSIVRAIAIAWVAVITILFVLPPNELAGYAFAATTAALAADWVFRMRRKFSGPPFTRW